MDRASMLSPHQNVHVSRRTRALKLLHTSLPLKSHVMWGSDANSCLSLSTNPTILTFFCTMPGAAMIHLSPCRPPYSPLLQSPTVYEQWWLLRLNQSCVEWTTCCLTLMLLHRLRTLSLRRILHRSPHPKVPKRLHQLHQRQEENF